MKRTDDQSLLWPRRRWIGRGAFGASSQQWSADGAKSRLSEERHGPAAAGKRQLVPWRQSEEEGKDTRG